ncbi:uncharacterized protein E6C27_scaffold437G00090 [Cucumis melo var. makuwa]|uniref:Retrotransposon gag domain-containing protein n=1 Tax=Cucumis melo var. makuwa TaxID=1194695 RepID=A0A5A7UMQ3_CUCMM|nr:uncharacterized protein E6C27_scaffold437G00090 [Cucumis melo var. makuwa]
MPRRERERGRGQASEAAKLVNVQARRERKKLLFAKTNLEGQFSIERLKALGATTYEGIADPANVEKWLRLVNKCFGVISCPKARKVKLATFLLEGNAKDWWILFEAKAREKRRELLSLEQSDKTVAMYEKKFTQLVKYAITFILDEEGKCKRFKEYLRTATRAVVTSSASWSDFSKLVEATIHAEKCLAEGDEEKMLKEEKSSPRMDRAKEKGGSKEVDEWAKSCFSQRLHWFDSRRPKCQECGKKHAWTCRHKIICFKCGKLDITKMNVMKEPQLNFEDEIPKRMK